MRFCRFSAPPPVRSSKSSVLLPLIFLLTMFSNNTLLVHCGGGPADENEDYGSPTARDQSPYRNRSSFLDEQRMRGGPAVAPAQIVESTTPMPIVQSGGGRFKKFGNAFNSGLSNVNQHVLSPARSVAGNVLNTAHSSVTEVIGGVKNVYGKVREEKAPKATDQSANSANDKANSTDSAKGGSGKDGEKSGKNGEKSGKDGEKSGKDGEKSGKDGEKQQAEDQTVEEAEANDENEPKKGKQQSAEESANSESAAEVNDDAKVGPKGGKCPLRSVTSLGANAGIVGTPLKAVAGRLFDTAQSSMNVVGENVVKPAKGSAMKAFNVTAVPVAQHVASALRSVSTQFDKVTEWKDEKQREEEEEEKREEKKEEEE